MSEKPIKENHTSCKTLNYSPLSQLEHAILNNLDASIYIADMDSYEILYMNNNMKREFGGDYTGKMCWEFIYENQREPCDSCTNNKLIDGEGNPNKPYIWQVYNQKFNNWYELHDQAIPWANGRFVRMGIATNITNRKKTEQALKETLDTLEQKVKERTVELEEMNTALKVLLKKLDKDKKDIEKQIISNVSNLILPYLKKLAKTNMNSRQQALLNIIEGNVAEVISPISNRIASSSFGFTLTEIKVANLIKDGKKSKEIAEILNLAPRTIEKYREKIRSKLSIQNKKVNLQTYLASLH